MRTTPRQSSIRSHEHSAISRQTSTISRAPSRSDSRATVTTSNPQTSITVDEFGHDSGIFIPERRHFLCSDADVVQLSSSYKRISKSRTSLNSRKPGSITTRSSDAGLGGPDDSPGIEVRNPGAKGMPKSMSFLRGGVDYMPPSVRDEYRKAASSKASVSYLHAAPSFPRTVRGTRDQKAFRTTMRGGSGSNQESSTAYHRSSGTVTNLRHRKSFSEKARDVSVSLKYRIKRLISKIEGAPPTFPPQQTQATRPHFRDFAGASLAQAYHDVPDIGSTTPRKLPFDRSFRATGSQGSSLRSRSAHSINGVQSRITSWTNSISLDSDAPSRLMTEAERKRLSIIKEHGLHVPSSSAGSHLRSATRERSGRRSSVFRQPIREHSPGEVGVSQSRLASALVKEIDRAAPTADMMQDDGTALRKHMHEFERSSSLMGADPTARVLSNDTIVNRSIKVAHTPISRKVLSELPADSPDPTKDAAFYRKSLYRKASQTIDPAVNADRAVSPGQDFNSQFKAPIDQRTSANDICNRDSTESTVDHTKDQLVTPGSVYSKTTQNDFLNHQADLFPRPQPQTRDTKTQIVITDHEGRKHYGSLQPGDIVSRPSVEVEQEVLSALVKEIQGLSPIKGNRTEGRSAVQSVRAIDFVSVPRRGHHRENAEVGNGVLPNVTNQTRAAMSRVPSRKSSKAWELRDMARRASWRLKGTKSMVALRKENAPVSNLRIAPVPNSIMIRERRVLPSIKSYQSLGKESTASLRSVRSHRDVPIMNLARPASIVTAGSYVSSAQHVQSREKRDERAGLTTGTSVPSGNPAAHRNDGRRQFDITGLSKVSNSPAPVNENLTFGRSNSLLKPSKVLAQEHVRKMQAMSSKLRTETEHRLSSVRAPLAPMSYEGTPKACPLRSETAQSTYVDYLSPLTTARDREVYSPGLIDDYNCSASDLGLYRQDVSRPDTDLAKQGLGSLVKSGLAAGSSTTIGTIANGLDLSPGKIMAEEFLTSRRGRSGRPAFM